MAPVTAEVSLDESYDDFPRIEEAFQQLLDESLGPRGPDSLWDLFATVGSRPGSLAVDVGCGEGDEAIELARRFGLRVRGVDPVQRHVDLAQAAAEEAGLAGEVTFSLGRAERLPLGDAEVDVAWSKEALLYADLDLACAELRRVLRPGGVGFLAQVFTGPRMTDDEAVEFWGGTAGARSVRPEDVERALASAGLVLVERVDLAGEWGEWAQERTGAGGRRLLHAARLLRAPERYRAAYGDAAYRIMLDDCLWHVYRMIGKLHGAVITFRAP